MNETAVAIYIVPVLIPTLPLLVTWRQVLVRRESLAVSSIVTAKLPLLVVTASCLLFVVNLLFSPTTGITYSNTRFAVIVTAFGVSLTMVVLTLAGKAPFKWPLASAAVA